MKQFLTSLLTLRRRAVFALASAIMLSGAMNSSLRAADVTWNNGSANLLWDLSSLNWSTGAWNNANGDGAIFGATGVGTIDVTSPINADSLSFTANNYILNGAGSLTFVEGTSTQGTGFINVEPSVTATINTAINSSLGLIKFGGGTLELSAPINFTGNGLTLTPNLNSDVIVAGLSGVSLGGTVRLMNSSVLPASTRGAISNGRLDIGNSNTTIAALTFINQADGSVFDPGTNSAGTGVIGTGTLRVTGEINTLGVSFGSFGSNTVAPNFDLGGGTQVVRVGGQGAFISFRALQFTGVLSNGSLLRTLGFNLAGNLATADGMALYGNNTYTGSTLLNGGSNIMTGTNATTSVRILGTSGPQGSTLTLQGANGSLGAATLIQAFAGSQFIIDNTSNTDLPPGGDFPPVPSAQNNNRIRDDAEIQLRNGISIYRGRSATVASETFGNLSLLDGQNQLQIVAGSAGGTVTLTASGNLSLAPRATWLVNSTTLSAASKLFINGTLPAADATGILPHIVTSNDFVTYNGTTGLTPLAAGAYANNFTTPGANVAVSAASTVASSIDINALKTAGTFTTTIGAGQTLGITSGMVLNTAFGTNTYTGGTIAFGSAPGTFFGSTNIINSALAGTAGLINANSTLTLNADLSGLTGTITNNQTLNLNTNTFAGGLEHRNGTLNINTSQTLAGQGAIRIGIPENDANLVGSVPLTSFSGAGADAIIGRDIIYDNGSQNAAGAEFNFGNVPTLQPLVNSSGSQTFSGNIILNSPGKLQGGAGSGTGATIFSGNISGPARFYVPNGRAIFSGNVGNAGGFRIGEGGFTAPVTFTGTTTGSAPITLVHGNSTFVAYNAGSLPTGPITVQGQFNALSRPSIIPLQDSTINNVINLNADAIGNVGGGITAQWAGPISGTFGLEKIGTGTLGLGNATNSYAGGTTISGGTLAANADGSLGTGNISLSAASVTLTLQGGTTHNYIADTATLNIGFTNDTVNLAFSGTDTIKALVINGVSQATGTWGSPKSGATHTDPIFTGTGMLNVLTQLTVSSAVSRKNHGGTDFDLPLPLSPNTPAVESRVGGGSTNDHTIIVNFNDSVAVGGNPQAELIAGSGAIGSGGTPNGGTVTVSGNTITIPLTNVTNQQVIQVRLNGVNGSNSFIIPMGVLVGDTNGNGSVNAADIGQTKAQSGQGVNAANFRQDVNLSGDINAADIALVKSASGTSLP